MLNKGQPSGAANARGISIVEDVRVPATAVSPCVRLFIELLLDGPSGVTNDVPAGRPGEASDRPQDGSALATN
jgi:hypothetical protein